MNHDAWCQSLFNSLAEGGVWGIPRSGLLFRKQNGKLVLFETMPYDKEMPISPAELQEQQEGEFQAVKQYFESAGISVVKP